MYLRHQLGREAEQNALEWFLKERPSRLLMRNFRCRGGEIDLIFEEVLPNKKGLELVFVEVRAKTDANWLTGPESVGPNKQRRLRNTAHHFLSYYRGPAKTLRVDLMHWDGRCWSHLPNIWLPQ
jgi:putative endonuclease